MAKSGQCHFEDLKKLQNQFKSLRDQEVSLFLDSCAKELAARLLRKVIKRTRPGEYPISTGKQGGTLQKGWTFQDGDTAQVRHEGKTYVVEICNPVEYASYVEFGHRTRNHTGWVRGKFMMTLSEQELRAVAPAILEKKLRMKLEECFR